MLRRSLHDLNNQLPGCLEIDRRTVRFSPTAPATVDIHRLTNLFITPNDIDAWAAAAAFLRAPFLHGIYVDDAPDLESWLLREQEHWKQATTRVLQRLIQKHTDEAAYSLALLYVQQLLALEPWREEAHRQAMLLLARTGQASAALVQYATCRRILQEELDVEPDGETDLLYARIKAMDLAPTSSSAANHYSLYRTRARTRRTHTSVGRTSLPACYDYRRRRHGQDASRPRSCANRDQRR